jgi:uncharacterized protein (DUF697 family)/predicted GTPase
MFRKLWDRARRLFSPSISEEELRGRLDKLRQSAPVPVIWLFGKTQSGKTSLVRYLTGAERAEIGRGYQPCTRFSVRYSFPSEQAPLLSFLDTRGLDEPGYDAAEDLEKFGEEAHVVVVTVKALDHAQENVYNQLKRIRAAKPQRPVVLVLTCLHEAYPQQQHPQPYPFDAQGQLVAAAPTLPEGLLNSIDEQRRRFEGLADRIVAVDFTPVDEGFAEPSYGGQQLRDVLVDILPAAQAQTLRTLEVAQRELQDFYAQNALPTILGYSTLAATAGAVPIPFVDLLLISGVQTGMMHELARFYGQALTAQRLGEIAGALGLGLLGRQASRSLIKVIPGLGSVLGSVAGGALAGASTFALGKAFCYYYRAVLEGHVPKPEDLRRYYKDQLGRAEEAWKRLHPAPHGQ